MALHYNFGPGPLAPLPFTCRMVKERLVSVGDLGSCSVLRRYVLFCTREGSLVKPKQFEVGIFEQPLEQVGTCLLFLPCGSWGQSDILNLSSLGVEPVPDFQCHQVCLFAWWIPRQKLGPKAGCLFFVTERLPTHDYSK